MPTLLHIILRKLFKPNATGLCSYHLSFSKNNFKLGKRYERFGEQGVQKIKFNHAEMD